MGDIISLDAALGLGMDDAQRLQSKDIEPRLTKPIAGVVRYLGLFVDGKYEGNAGSQTDSRLLKEVFYSFASQNRHTLTQ